MEEKALKPCCANCAKLKYWKMEDADCCSYALYRCLENRREVIDDFHIDYKKCKNYKEKVQKEKLD